MEMDIYLLIILFYNKMGKKVFLTALCALALCPAMAQTSETEEKVEYSSDKYKVETNRFWSNWFVSVGGGAQMYFGNHDKQADFGDRLGGALELRYGAGHVGRRRAADTVSVEGTGDLIDVVAATPELRVYRAELAGVRGRRRRAAGKRAPADIGRQPETGCLGALAHECGVSLANPKVDLGLFLLFGHRGLLPWTSARGRRERQRARFAVPAQGAGERRQARFRPPGAPARTRRQDGMCTHSHILHAHGREPTRFPGHGQVSVGEVMATHGEPSNVAGARAGGA